VLIDCPFGDLEFDRENYYLTTETALKRFFKKVNDRAYYTYDFGDGWDHEIILEKIMSHVPKKSYPVCVDGELSCPPEDCGGVSGYYDCVSVLANRDNRSGLLDWLEKWLPDDFDPKKVKFESPRRRLKRALAD
jgi:hypothetical protein